MSKQGSRRLGVDRIGSFQSRRRVRTPRRAYPAKTGDRMPGAVAALSLVMAALPLVAFAFCFAAPTPARAGVAFGLRGGYTDVDSHAFVGSGKIGGTPLVGLQAVLPIVPLISLVIAGEQSTKNFDFTTPTIGTLHAAGRAKWTDRALYAAARVRVPGAVGLYGGAGVGMHMLKTDLSGVVQTTAAREADTQPSARVAGPRRAGAATVRSPLDDFLSRAEKEANNLSWHAFAGLELSIPVVPVAVFAEGRIDDIQGSAPRSLAAYAGFNLKLP